MRIKTWMGQACALLLAAFVLHGEEPGTQKLRFVQDDAQDYMVSKIYVLKYVQANDITPWVMSIVKRYNMNSVVNCIEYGNNNEQILTVTCPVGMMPYVDDFIAKVDRNIEVDGKVPGDVIKGTGITRAVYRPKYRSGQDLINIIVNAFINEGPYGSVYGYDQNSNQIYWKDNTTNTEFMYQFLGWLDRPAPQINLVFNVYEVRESTLRDMGIEYLAWKNGPGLNLFQVGWDVFSISSGGSAAIQAASGPLGGFFFAPQFDASFIRILQQDGKADIKNTASLTVSNSDSKTYELLFNPQLQNIVKSNNDQTSVVLSAISQQQGLSQIYLKVIKPIVCLHSGPQLDFEIPNYRPGQYAAIPGTLYFGYDVQTANVVERNNYGAELIETSQIQGNSNIELNKEKVLAAWDKEDETEQTIGVPFLSDIPILKYLFSTTTTSREKTHVYLTVTAEMLNTGIQSEEIGRLQKLK
ncbi:hypothetical protein [Victivallis sp. Marseille-Q1083]|uniref:hypothetical protein n=1 Tax=Victivallis sp. Marseille-Q1083 TaxID=2717288 RepID=UPI00158DEB16|nr:hypothetical protein [Victivallis sp. Marseille-Q1083]